MSMTLEEAQVPRQPKPVPSGPDNVLEQFNLKDRVVVVTGAAEGIGGAVVDSMAEAGANVALWYRSNDKAVTKAEELAKNSRSIKGTKSSSTRGRGQTTEHSIVVTEILVKGFEYAHFLRGSPSTSSVLSVRVRRRNMGCMKWQYKCNGICTIASLVSCTRGSMLVKTGMDDEHRTKEMAILRYEYSKLKSELLNLPNKEKEPSTYSPVYKREQSKRYEYVDVPEIGLGRSTRPWSDPSWWKI